MAEALTMYGVHGLGLPRAAQLPPVFSQADRAGNMLAMLSTNEYLQATTIERVRTSCSAPNGYIAGVGVGNIFHLPDLFPPGSRPLGIACTDVLPEVVLLGRVFVRNAARSDTLEEAIDRTHGADSIPSYVSAIRDEHDPATRKRFIRAIPDIIDWMKMRPDMSRLSQFPEGGGEVVRALRRHFGLIRELAAAGKITVAYASFTDPAWLEYVTGLPGWNNARNVIYASNIADHLGNRGRNRERVEGLHEAFGLLARTGDHWYADTTDHSLEYNLRVTQTPPRYDADDFTFR